MHKDFENVDHKRAFCLFSLKTWLFFLFLFLSLLLLDTFSDTGAVQHAHPEIRESIVDEQSLALGGQLPEKAPAAPVFTAPS